MAGVFSQVDPTKVPALPSTPHFLPTTHHSLLHSSLASVQNSPKVTLRIARAWLRGRPRTRRAGSASRSHRWPCPTSGRRNGRVRRLARSVFCYGPIMFTGRWLAQWGRVPQLGCTNLHPGRPMDQFQQDSDSARGRQAAVEQPLRPFERTRDHDDPIARLKSRRVSARRVCTLPGADRVDEQIRQQYRCCCPWQKIGNPGRRPHAQQIV